MKASFWAAREISFSRLIMSYFSVPITESVSFAASQHFQSNWCYFNRPGQVSYHFGPIKEEHIGFMMGSKANTLVLIRNTTGAYVKIMPSDQYHSTKWFLVTGSNYSVKWAVNWLWNIQKEAYCRIKIENEI